MKKEAFGLLFLLLDPISFTIYGHADWTSLYESPLGSIFD